MKNFIKKEPVLFAAILLAMISVVLIRPGFGICIGAIDLRTISILFCLMIVIKAFQSQNFLDFIAAKLLILCRTQRTLYFLLIFLVFFISMFVTNDVALLTFVPLTILIFKRIKLPCLRLVVMETLAANLGSCITPMGNPQNLYLYSYYNFNAVSFFGATLKIGIPAGIILAVMICFITEKNKRIEGNMLQSQIVHVKFDWRSVLYFCNFVISLLTVFRVMDFKITLVVTIVIMAVCNWHLFKVVDYSLLFTFAGFFIFTGTISTVPSFSNFIKSALATPLLTYVTGILTSQIISNVPASLLLSGFTDLGEELLLAVNVGGLGTLIASMASVISFKLYNVCEEGKSETGKSYFKIFTIYNFVLLVIVGIVVWFLRLI